MTENMKVAMTAINKWVFYCLNYNVVEVEVADFDGNKKEYLPDCFNAFPMWVRKHLAGKFHTYYEDCGGYGAMTKFYANLDDTNRKLVLEWVVGNYKDEQKMTFKGED